MASETFERNIMLPPALPSIGSYPDVVLTTGFPEFRQDGLAINRKATFVAKDQLGPRRYRAIHLFETIMARGGSFVGIGTINKNVEQCLNQFNQPQLCSYDPAYLKEWAQFVLATQMSTYPVY